MEQRNEMRVALDGLGISQTELARRMKDLGDDRDEKNILRSIQRMVAGDIRVSGEMRALLGSMRKAAPIELDLTFSEARVLEAAATYGYEQSLKRRLVQKMRDRFAIKCDYKLIFADEEFGELIRYMTRDGSGEFRQALRQAFKRPLGQFLQMIAK